MKNDSLLDKVKKAKENDIIIHNENVGFISAKEIIEDVNYVCLCCQSRNISIFTKNFSLNDLFLSKELYDWRCEQYKKYKNYPEKFSNIFPKLYTASKQQVNKWDEWLFDFVMNGGLDKK